MTKAFAEVTNSAVHLKDEEGEIMRTIEFYEIEWSTSRHVVEGDREYTIRLDDMGREELEDLKREDIADAAYRLGYTITEWL